MAELLGTSSVLGVRSADAWIANKDARKKSHKEKIFMLTASLAEVPEISSGCHAVAHKAASSFGRAASAGAAERIAFSSPATNDRLMTTMSYKKSLALEPINTAPMWLGPRFHTPITSTGGAASVARKRKKVRPKNLADPDLERLTAALEGNLLAGGAKSIRWDRTPLTDVIPLRLGSFHVPEEDVQHELTLITEMADIMKGDPVQWVQLATPELHDVPVGIEDILSRTAALAHGRAAFEASCKSAAHRIVTEHISGTNRPSIPPVHSQPGFALYNYKKTRFVLQKGSDAGGLDRQLDVLADLHALDLHHVMVVPFACKVFDRGFNVWCCAGVPRCAYAMKCHDYLGVLKIKIGTASAAKKPAEDLRWQRGPVRSKKKGTVDGLPEEDDCTLLTDRPESGGQGLKEVTPLAMFLEAADVGIDEHGHGYIRAADPLAFPNSWKEAVESAKSFNSGVFGAGGGAAVHRKSQPHTPTRRDSPRAARSPSTTHGVHLSPRAGAGQSPAHSPVDLLSGITRGLSSQRPSQDYQRLVPQNPIRDTNTTAELRKQQRAHDYPMENQLAWALLVLAEQHRQKKLPLAPEDLAAQATQFGFTPAVWGDIAWLLANPDHIAPKPMLGKWLPQELEAIEAVMTTEMACQAFCDVMGQWMREVCPKGVVSEKALTNYAMRALVHAKAQLHERMWAEMEEASMRIFGDGCPLKLSFQTAQRQHLLPRSSAIFGVQLPHCVREPTLQSLSALPDMKPNDLELHVVMSTPWSASRGGCADTPWTAHQTLLQTFHLPDGSALRDVKDTLSGGGLSGMGGGTSTAAGTFGRLPTAAEAGRVAKRAVQGLCSEVKNAATAQMKALEEVVAGTSVAMVAFAGPLLALITDTQNAADRQPTTVGVVEDLWRRILFVHQMRLLDADKKRITAAALPRSRRRGSCQPGKFPNTGELTKRGSELPDPRRISAMTGGDGLSLSRRGSAMIGVDGLPRATDPRRVSTADHDVGGFGGSIALYNNTNASSAGRAEGQADAAAKEKEKVQDPPSRIFIRALQVVVFVPAAGGDAGLAGMIATLTSLAEWYNCVELYAKARDVTEQIVAMQSVRSTSDSEGLTHQRRQLEFLMKQREYGEAVALFEKMLALADGEHGPSHAVTLDLLTRFTQYLMQMKQAEEAGSWLHVLARRAHQAGRAKDAEAALVQCVKCCRKAFTATHPTYLTVLHHLARANFLCKHYKKVPDTVNTLSKALQAAQMVFPLPYHNNAACLSYARMQDDIDVLKAVALSRLAGAAHGTTVYHCPDPFDVDPFADPADEAAP